jgi:hypothetical protein
MNTKTLCLLFALGSSALSAGCARGYAIETPDGFAELDDNDDYGYRATSAEGVVLAVRKEDNDPKGGLDFWSTAVKNDLSARGYQLAKTKSIKSKNGVAGQELRYETVRSGRPNVLWVAVFVSGKHVIVVEAGGDVAHFEKSEDKVEAAIENLEVS